VTEANHLEALHFEERWGVGPDLPKLEEDETIHDHELNFVESKT